MFGVFILFAVFSAVVGESLNVQLWSVYHAESYLRNADKVEAQDWLACKEAFLADPEYMKFDYDIERPAGRKCGLYKNVGEFTGYTSKNETRNQFRKLDSTFPIFNLVEKLETTERVCCVSSVYDFVGLMEKGILRLDSSAVKNTYETCRDWCEARGHVSQMTMHPAENLCSGFSLQNDKCYLYKTSADDVVHLQTSENNNYYRIHDCESLSVGAEGKVCSVPESAQTSYNGNSGDSIAVVSEQGSDKGLMKDCQKQPMYDAAATNPVRCLDACLARPGECYAISYNIDALPWSYNGGIRCCHYSAAAWNGYESHFPETAYNGYPGAISAHSADSHIEHLQKVIAKKTAIGRTTQTRANRQKLKKLRVKLNKAIARQEKQASRTGQQAFTAEEDAPATNPIWNHLVYKIRTTDKSQIVMQLSQGSFQNFDTFWGWEEINRVRCDSNGWSPEGCANHPTGVAGLAGMQLSMEETTPSTQAECVNECGRLSACDAADWNAITDECELYRPGSGYYVTAREGSTRFVKIKTQPE